MLRDGTDRAGRRMSSMQQGTQQGTQPRPLAEVRENLRVDWYRSPIEPAKLRALMRRSDWQGLFQTGGHLALVAATGVLCFLLWERQMWVGFAFALFLHGSFGSFLPGAATHELGHGTVFRTKWLNKLALYLISLPSWWNPFDYAMSHTYHHRYTLHPEGDREVILPLQPTPGLSAILTLFTISLFKRPVNIFGRGGAAARRCRGRLSPVHAVGDRRPADRVPLLADELAHRASHVRRGAVL